MDPVDPGGGPPENPLEAVPAPTGFPAGPGEAFGDVLGIHRLPRAGWGWTRAPGMKAGKHLEVSGGGLGLLSPGDHGARQGAQKRRNEPSPPSHLTQPPLTRSLRPGPDLKDRG